MIMYELWLTCVLSELDREVDFEFLIPKLFDSKKAAEQAIESFYILPTILDNGEVAFDIYGKDMYYEKENQQDLLIDTIHWTDYKKYNCIIMKKAGASTTIGELFPDEEWIKTAGLANLLCASEDDYVPCSKKFEDIYNKYLSHNDISEICKHRLHTVAYDVKMVSFLP